jgi:hypothetical protein
MRPTEKDRPMKNIQLELAVDDINTILESLGALPFARVYALIGRIQEQARRQIDAQAAQAEQTAPNGADREQAG